MLFLYLTLQPQTHPFSGTPRNDLVLSIIDFAKRNRPRIRTLDELTHFTDQIAQRMTFATADHARPAHICATREILYFDL